MINLTTINLESKKRLDAKRTRKLKPNGKSNKLTFNILPVFPNAGPRLKELKMNTGVLASMRKSLSAKFATRILPGVRSDRHLEEKRSCFETVRKMSSNLSYYIDTANDNPSKFQL